MTVNMGNSTTMIHWRGVQSLATKHFVKRKLHHSVLRIPSDSSQFFEIPIAEKHDYLGVQVGYKQPLRNTMQRRFLHHKQMKQWFNKNPLHRAQKLSLWLKCFSYSDLRS